MAEESEYIKIVVCQQHIPSVTKLMLMREQNTIKRLYSVLSNETQRQMKKCVFFLTLI